MCSSQIKIQNIVLTISWVSTGNLNNIINYKCTMLNLFVTLFTVYNPFIIKQ